MHLVRLMKIRRFNESRSKDEIPHKFNRCVVLNTNCETQLIETSGILALFRSWPNVILITIRCLGVLALKSDAELYSFALNYNSNSYAYWLPSCCNVKTVKIWTKLTVRRELKINWFSKIHINYSGVKFFILL